MHAQIREYPSRHGWHLDRLTADGKSEAADKPEVHRSALTSGCHVWIIERTRERGVAITSPGTSLHEPSHHAPGVGERYRCSSRRSNVNRSSAEVRSTRRGGSEIGTIVTVIDEPPWSIARRRAPVIVT
jgi:hypothetical protein